MIGNYFLDQKWTYSSLNSYLCSVPLLSLFRFTMYQMLSYLESYCSISTTFAQPHTVVEEHSGFITPIAKLYRFLFLFIYLWHKIFVEFILIVQFTLFCGFRFCHYTKQNLFIDSFLFTVYLLSKNDSFR